MAAPSYVGKGAVNSGTGSSITPGYGSLTVAAGDLLFILAINKQLGGTIGGITAPAGWTEDIFGTYSNNAPTSAGTISLFWKKAVGGESGTVTVNRTGDTGGTHQFSAQIYQFTGFNPYIESSSINVLGNGVPTVTWNSVTVGGTERTLAAFVGSLSSTGLSAPATYTEAKDEVSAGPIEVTLLIGVKANVSSDGSVSSASGDDDGWGAIHVSIYNAPKGAKNYAYFID
jgi:hypothetical protein